MGKVAKQGLETRKQAYELLVAKVRQGRSLTPSELSSMARLEAELVDSGLDTPESFASVKEVAEFSGYSVRTVYAAVQAGELRRLSDESFDFIDVSSWLEGKKRRPVAAAAAEDAGVEELPEGEYRSKDEEAKYRHFRARREEIIVRKLLHELVPIAEVNRQNVRRVHEFKTSLLLLSRSIDYKIAAAVGVESALVREIVDAEVLELLRSLSRKVVLDVD